MKRSTEFRSAKRDGYPYHEVRFAPLSQTAKVSYDYYIIKNEATMKNYRVRVETYDGCVTIWYEKSKAKEATSLILNRVCQQLAGLNVKKIGVELSV